ncbi:rho-related protein racA [Lingula anatina]|uniref:Rho-related protein racA n=1 Tax=Lingula anatina TaxID=7574 RepID=A0A1S3HG70_LINAN|nr:rho-related protein racA [Lingula anatina]|eukprot:XP_013385052.1 rho-related protein racA [Lingula anatina]
MYSIGKAPWLTVETSTFAEDWKKVLQNPVHADVTFLVEGQQHLDAHRVILCGASKMFRQIFSRKLKEENNQLTKFSPGSTFTWEDIASGKVEGLAGIWQEKQEGNKDIMKTVIELSADIKGAAFVQVLEFLYTGVPDLKDDISDQELDEITRVAKIFQLPHLETICRNKKNEEEFLNPSIGTFLNDLTGQSLKELFLNQPEWADIVFIVEGQKVYAHRVVLSARCDVLSAMFSGHFSEGSSCMTEVPLSDVTSECFLAFLEYLYTDHAPIEDGDSVGIMVLADEYCQRRLVNLCELYITKEVDRSCRDNIEKSDIDVIGLLLTSQIHNAEQLANWCLHFISTNYQCFKNRPEFPLLQEKNLEYVEENQWPPVEYLNELREYEKLTAKSEEKCSIM